MKRMHSHQEIQDDAIDGLANKGVTVEEGVLKAPIIEQLEPSIAHSYTIDPPGPIYITPYCVPKVAVKVINSVLHIDVDVMLGNHSAGDYTGSIRLFFQDGLDEWEKKLKRIDGTALTANSTEHRIAYVPGVQDGTPIAAVLQSASKNKLSLDTSIKIATGETASMISVHACIPII